MNDISCHSQATPIRESSASQLFIFHMYLYIVIFIFCYHSEHIAHLEKVQSINECMCTSNLLDYSQAEKSSSNVLKKFADARILPFLMELNGTDYEL